VRLWANLDIRTRRASARLPSPTLEDTDVHDRLITWIRVARPPDPPPPT
jgi:hypothetical protein